MKAIIIAAGMCTRLRPYTDILPKCMLSVKGKTLLQHALDIFRSEDISDISIIRGFMKEKIVENNVTYFENTGYENNNILHSLLCARDKIEEAVEKGEEVIATYSDILFDESVVKSLLESKDAISCVVDTDWEAYYDGRTDHPIEEAENVVFDEENKIVKIGKHVMPGKHESLGEFIGMFKFTAEGAKIFLKHIDRLNEEFGKKDAFQNAKEWQKAYITDIMQELVDKKEIVGCTLIQQGWKELDTVQDFLKAGGEPPQDD